MTLCNYALKSIQNLFVPSAFLTITMCEHYGLSDGSITPRPIIFLTSETTVSRIANGIGYCFDLIGSVVVNFIS